MLWCSLYHVQRDQTQAAHTHTHTRIHTQIIPRIIILFVFLARLRSMHNVHRLSYGNQPFFVQPNPLFSWIIFFSSLVHRLTNSLRRSWRQPQKICMLLHSFIDATVFFPPLDDSTRPGKQGKKAQMKWRRKNYTPLSDERSYECTFIFYRKSLRTKYQHFGVGFVSVCVCVFVIFSFAFAELVHTYVSGILNAFRYIRAQ